MTEGLLVPLLSMEGPRIVIEIHNSQPIDLLDFTGSLTALAREHEAALKRERPGLAAEESRLLVVDIRRGSIVLELVAALAPFVSQAELINTSVDFVRNIGDALSLLRQPGEGCRMQRHSGSKISMIPCGLSPTILRERWIFMQGIKMGMSYRNLQCNVRKRLRFNKI